MALPPSLHKAAERLTIWYGVYGIVAAAFSWLGSQMEALKPYGWPEAILFGIVMAGFVALIASAFMVAYRKFRPLPAVVPQDSEFDFDLTPQGRVEGLEALRDTVDAVAKTLREQREDDELPAGAIGSRLDAIEVATKESDKDLKAQGEELRSLKADIARLTYFALRQASVAKLAKLLSDAPSVMPDEELNVGNYMEQSIYLGHLRSNFSGPWRAANLSELLTRAEHEAEQSIQHSRAAAKLGPADIIQFRKWLIANLQVARAVAFLASEKRKLEEEVAADGYPLSEQFQRLN